MPVEPEALGETASHLRVVKHHKLMVTVSIIEDRIKLKIHMFMKQNEDSVLMVGVFLGWCASGCFGNQKIVFMLPLAWI